jgi:hypothetical protein
VHGGTTHDIKRCFINYFLDLKTVVPRAEASCHAKKSNSEVRREGEQGQLYHASATERALGCWGQEPVSASGA